MKCFHTPVLLKETLELLHIEPGGLYVDCNLGMAGHATAILEKGSPRVRLLGIDADPESIEIAMTRLQPFGKAALTVNEGFENLEELCARYDFRPVKGILFDLGISSFQLEDKSRGFSFSFDAPLDMRFNPDQSLTAATIVNTFSEAEIASILRTYGEERHHRRIAREIIAHRPVNTTLQLVKIVERKLGAGRGRIHPATRTFQALRIAVNRELANLEKVLEQTLNVLSPGGRLVVISYHSLEDRLVKEFMRRESRDCLCPPDVPVCVCGHSPTLKLVNRKAVTPSVTEMEANPRSRSAKLRAAERL
ncbi:16S rRNA (cytosine(1402)-N(4))-methyltransferase RsmH [Chloroflexota bacterium]